MSYFEDVKDWHKRFNLAIADSPIEPDWPTRSRLVTEEFKELIDAIVEQNKVKTLDGLVDLAWVCIGMAVSAGWDFDAAWEEVKKSNWSKADENGNPIINEWGKLLKGPNFKPPKLEGIVK